MPKGISLSRRNKELIFHNCRVLQKSPDAIFSEIFMNDSSKVSLRYLVDVCREIEKKNDEWDTIFLNPLTRSGGPEFRMCSFDKQFLVDHINKRRLKALTVIAEEFTQSFYSEEDLKLSIKPFEEKLRKNTLPC